MRVDSASDDEEEEVVEAPPEPPEDAVLAAVLERRSSMVASAIATDTLLVENDAERLEKGEEADAIDEYERERDGRPTRAEEERRAEIRRQYEAEAAQREAAQREARERAAREKAAPLPAGWTRHRNTGPTAQSSRTIIITPSGAERVRQIVDLGAHDLGAPGLTPPEPWVPPAPAPAAHTWPPTRRSTRPRPWPRRWRRCPRPRRPWRRRRCRPGRRPRPRRSRCRRR